jgi:hypothetical protein
MSAQPDRALMRAVAEVVIGEEKARAAADRELAADMARLRERLDEFKSIVPPELAEQVKAAIHLLHESPPIVQQNAPSAFLRPPPRPRRIERNENGGFTLIYEESQA